MQRQEPAVLEVKDLTLAWGPEAVLHCPRLEARGGSVTWIEGASGAGKSSLLRALARLIPVRGGDMRLGGAEVSAMSPHRWRSRVLLVPTPPAALGETVGEALRAPYRLRAFGSSPVPAAEALLRELSGLGLEEVALDRPTSQLSQGQLGRVAFLRGILAEPEVLLLDEPTANLDPASGRAVARRAAAFAARGAAVVVAGHGAPWEEARRRYRIAGKELREAAP